MRTVKNPGSTFLIAIFLSTMILGVGLGAAKMVVKELEFSSDLLYGEQSYYAAESGVETVLVELRDPATPVQHIEGVGELPLGQATYEAEIINRVGSGNSIEFELGPLQSRRIRMIRDIDDDRLDAGYDPQISQRFDISHDGAATTWQWRVLCKQGDQTKAFENITTGNNISSFLQSTDGFGDDRTATIDFNNWISGFDADEQRSCIFVVQNLADAPAIFTLVPQGASLPPLQAAVTSIGRSGNRQKSISFDYEQTLGGIFDFVFYHEGD